MLLRAKRERHHALRSRGRRRSPGTLLCRHSQVIPLARTLPPRLPPPAASSRPSARLSSPSRPGSPAAPAPGEACPVGARPPAEWSRSPLRSPPGAERSSLPARFSAQAAACVVASGLGFHFAPPRTHTPISRLWSPDPWSRPVSAWICLPNLAPSDVLVVSFFTVGCFWRGRCSQFLDSPCGDLEEAISRSTVCPLLKCGVDIVTF